MPQRLMTLSRKIREDERRHGEATGVFSDLLEQIALAAKVISREVNKAGLVDLLGITGETNIQGEEVCKLDAFANDTLTAMLAGSGHLAAMASEETEDVMEVPRGGSDAKYLALFDPLNGSSNIDANVSVGTIFGILGREGHGGTAARLTSPSFCGLAWSRSPRYALLLRQRIRRTGSLTLTRPLRTVVR